MKVGDIDVFEVNEAFAPVLLAWSEETGAAGSGQLPTAGRSRSATRSVRPGAILMTSGSRTRAHGGRYGLQTMCEGGGQANATIIERV